MVVLLGIGFASGLPSAYRLLGDSLSAWLGAYQVDIKTIGLFSLVGLPFALNFLWAPLLDRYAPPVLGRRRGWMLIIQILLVLAITGLALAGPTQQGESLQPLAIMGLVVAFLAATQDVVADAYRTDVLNEKQRGAGAAMFVNGYRIAILAAGGGAIFFSQYLPWRWVYFILALLMIPGIVATLLAPEAPGQNNAPKSMRDALIEPVMDFFGRTGARGLLILLFVVLFKLPDALANRMIIPVLQTELSFSPTVIAVVREWMGLGVAIAGALVGGAMAARIGMKASLILFGLLQALSNFGFCLLVMAGKNVAVLACVVAVENFSAGMVTAGFMAFLMSQCRRRYSATQYALFTSLNFFTGTIAGAQSGWFAEAIGFIWFFAGTVLAGLPGLLLLLWIGNPSPETPSD